MVQKRARPPKQNVAVETPITIGGGGGSLKAGLPVTIQYNAGEWVSTPGLLTLIGGNIKRIRLSAGDDVDIKVPVTGDVQISLKCTKG